MKTVPALCLLATAAPAQIVQVTQPSSWTTIVSATGDGLMAGPSAVAMEVNSGGSITRKILLGWTTNQDSTGVWPNTHGWISSTNGGATWGTATTSPNLDLTTAMKRRDGTIVAVPFFPKYPDTLPTSTMTFTYHTSTNNGTSWTEYLYNGANPGLIDFGAQQINGFRFHRGMIEGNDGTLYAPAYIGFVGDIGHRVVVMKSTNGGATWTYLSTIKYNSGVDHNETTIARCVNNSWLAVIRADSGGATQDLVYSRSTNQGLTWSSTATLPGISNADQGVDPRLILMPNGVMGLSYGNNIAGGAGRYCYLAFSSDGNGTSWSNVINTFTGITGVLESTGYTDIAAIRAHRLIQFSDTGINWSYSSAHPTPNPYSIREKDVDVVLSRRNRIDLEEKYSVGAITIDASTDLTYSNATHPEARTAGAFDGSTDYWSGAFKSGTSGTYTLDLQQTYTLTSVGICLQYNNAQSATVQLSTNGSSWTTVKTYTSATHNAIDYTDFAAAPARYVRVTVSGAGPMVSLNEIELYEVRDTFENNAQNAVPYGYTAATGGFWISEGTLSPSTGYQSTRALYMDDSDPSAGKTITRGVASSTSKTFQFRLRPRGYATGGTIQFHLFSGSTVGFRIAAFPDGSIKWYNGSAWVSTTGTGSPAGAGTVAFDAWSSIVITANASTNTATISVNGTAEGSAGEAVAISSMNGFGFGSAGTVPSGDKALFDDCYMN